MAADVDRTLAALADPARRAIVDLIRDRELRPSEVADALAMSRPAMSRHLRVLRTAGLVSEETSGEDARARLIRLRPEPLAELRGWLEDVEAFWAAQLAGFKAHAERGRRRKR